MRSLASRFLRLPARLLFDRPAVIGAIVVIVMLAVSGAGSSAQTTPITSFDLNARADTVSFSLTDPTLPLFSEIMFTPASAQASATSFGGSNGFAGAPYTGDMSTLLGTVNGLAAGALPILPSYMPGYVISSFPQNPGPNTQEVASYLVETHSRADGASAQARLGAATSDPGAVAATADSEVHVSEDGSVAHAEAWVGALRLGDLIGLGEVHTSATVSVDADGNVTKESSLEIGLLDIAGIDVGLGPDGLRLGSQSLGLIDLSILDQLLGQAGIELEYLPSVETETSITSAGVRVTMTHDVPTQGEVVVTFTLGQVSAAANVRIPNAAVDVPATTPPTTTPPLAGEQTPSVAAVPSVAPVPAPAVAAPMPAPAAAQVALPASVSVRSIDLGADGVDFYLILVLGFLAPIVASRVASALGVRVRH